MPPTNAPQSTPPKMPAQKPGAGPFFGIIVILIVILVGAFYFWGKALNEQQGNPPPYIPGDATTS